MASWHDVEELIGFWFRKANEPAWRDMEETREVIGYYSTPVPHRCLVEIARGIGIEHPLPLCETCNDRLGLTFFLEERVAETGVAVRPELRLSAANTSALKSRGW